MKKWAIIILLLLTAADIFQSPVFSNDSIQVFFTSPGSKKNSERTPEHQLVKLINNSESSFYGAFYELSASPVVKALVSAAERGIEVRLVLNNHVLSAPESSKATTALISLRSGGITVVTDNRPAFMHNKFAVIDEQLVWTGSYNATYNCGHRNNNNAVIIKSRELASIFFDEFQEMFEHGIFGNTTDDKPFSGLFNPSGRDKYYVSPGGTDINAYFSPENNVEKIIISRIKKARNTIHFMAFSFTSKGIAEAMIKAKERGVSIRGIFEKKGSNSRSSKYRLLKSQGADVTLDKNRYFLHHKVIVIDGETVITGSYNFSMNADKNNDENIVIINDSDIASLYIKEFNRLR